MERMLHWCMTRSWRFVFLLTTHHVVLFASQHSNERNFCNGEGWRPPFNETYPVDHPPRPNKYGGDLAPLRDTLSASFPRCTNYVKWSIPDDREFEATALCSIPPFDRLRYHQRYINCSAVEQGRELVLESKHYAPFKLFVTLMSTCQQEHPQYFHRYITTNLCTSSSQSTSASLILGCANTGPASNLKRSNAVLTNVKFVKAAPGFMRVIAWTGSAEGPLPLDQNVWRQHHYTTQLQVTWQHGSVQTAFANSTVCHPSQSQPLLFVAADKKAMWASESRDKGVNIWHYWHNIMFSSFATLYEAGMLRCDEVNGNCTVSSRFDFASLADQRPNAFAYSTVCVAVRKLFGQLGKCIGSTKELKNRCYEQVIVDSSTSSNNILYFSGKGSTLRLFARALENHYGLIPLTPSEVSKRPPHVVFLARPSDRRPGFDEESQDNLVAVMNESGIPFTRLLCRTDTKKHDISVLRRATVVIGASGAAFTNIWHLMKGAVVVVSTPGIPTFDLCFKSLALETGSTFIRWTPTQLNYKMKHFGFGTMYPLQSRDTWRVVLRTALLLQDAYARSHNCVMRFLEQTDMTIPPQDRRCHAMLMVYEPRRISD